MTEKERKEMRDHEAKLNRFVQKLSREDFGYIVGRYVEINRVERYNGSHIGARGDRIEFSLEGRFEAKNN